MATRYHFDNSLSLNSFVFFGEIKIALISSITPLGLFIMLIYELTKKIVPPNNSNTKHPENPPLYVSKKSVLEFYDTINSVEKIEFEKEKNFYISGIDQVKSLQTTIFNFKQETPEILKNNYRKVVTTLSDIKFKYYTPTVFPQPFEDFEKSLFRHKSSDNPNYSITESNDKGLEITKFESDGIVRSFDPESLRKFKKVDYSKLKEIGDIGEIYTLEYEYNRLLMIAKNKESIKVIHVSHDYGDLYGFDIYSEFDGGNKRYIEVKTTISSDKSDFYMSQNEVNTMRKFEKIYFIYRCVQENSNDPKFGVEELSYEDFKNNFAVTPSSYRISRK